MVFIQLNQAVLWSWCTNEPQQPMCAHAQQHPAGKQGLDPPAISRPNEDPAVLAVIDLDLQ